MEFLTSTKELLEKFTEIVLKDTEESFVLRVKDRKSITTYSFMQRKVGKAKYIYHAYSWYREVLTDTTEKYEFIAVVSEKTVILKNKYVFGIIRNCENDCLPLNVRILNDSSSEFSEKVKKEIFNPFFDVLRIEGVKVNEKELRELARKAILSGRFNYYLSLSENNIFDSDDYFKYLCGFLNIKKEGFKRLKEKKKNWKEEKARQLKIRNLIDFGKVVENWELELAKAIQNTEAQTVLVTFNVGNNIVSAKIERDKILSHLLDDKEYDWWDFVNRQEGKVLLTYLLDEYNLKLESKHILKITYRKKVLYERNFVDDLSVKLSLLFEQASKKGDDELNFFLNLIEKGFTLNDIKTHLPNKFEYAKLFMKEHGLI